MNPVIAILKYFGVKVTREEYIKLATLGTQRTQSETYDPESEAEMEAAEAERLEGNGVLIGF